MNCAEVQEQLSAFYDGELSDDIQSQVRQHVRHCARCAQELADFGRLTAIARGPDELQPPAEIWIRLESALDDENSEQSASPRRLGWHSATRILALAATLLVLAGLGWWGYVAWSGHRGHHEMASSFADYLDRFHQAPEAAQEMLLAKYDAQLVDPMQAVQLVGFRPAAADRLPAAYDAQATYVLKMPCCTCVQTVCRRKDGSTIAIFEHEEEHHEWLGNRPMNKVDCDGKQCMLCNVDNKLAATWQRGPRHITMVGLLDVKEVEELVSWLERSWEQDSS